MDNKKNLFPDILYNRPKLWGIVNRVCPPPPPSRAQKDFCWAKTEKYEKNRRLVYSGKFMTPQRSIYHIPGEHVENLPPGLQGFRRNEQYIEDDVFNVGRTELDLDLDYLGDRQVLLLGH